VAATGADHPNEPVRPGSDRAGSLVQPRPSNPRLPPRFRVPLAHFLENFDAVPAGIFFAL